MVATSFHVLIKDQSKYDQCIFKYAQLMELNTSQEYHSLHEEGEFYDLQDVLF